MSRPHPFDLLFADFRAGEFEAIRAELGPKDDLDSFLLSPPALEFMQQLRPDEGYGEGMDDFVALVHAGYRYWCDGEVTVYLEEPATRALCAASHRDEPEGAPARASYIQVAARLIWGQLAADAPFEPLDGWFIVPLGTGLRVVACFGVHVERPGISVVTVAGPLPGPVRRADGTPLFAPTLPGGAAADLLAVTAPEELLLLGFRSASAGESS